MGKLAKMRPNLAYRYGIRMPTSTAKISYKKVLNSKTTDPAYVIFHESKGWSHNLLASEKD